MSETSFPQQRRLLSRFELNLSMLYAPVIFAIAAGCVWGAYRGYVVGGVNGFIATGLLLLVLTTITVLQYTYKTAYIIAQWCGVGLTLLIISALNFDLGPFPHDPWYDGVPYLIGGVIALGLAVRADQFAPVPRWGGTVAQPPLRITWLCLIPGVFGVLLLAEISGQQLEIDALRWTLDAQFALMIAAYLLLWCGAGGIRWADLRVLREIRLTRTGIALVIITGLALLLRTWELEVAIHQFIDEMNFGRAVWGIKRPGVTHVGMMVPFSGVAAFPYIYPYWQTIGIDLFGWTLTALRIVSVVFGTLTVPALYFLVVTLLENKRLALIAALLLATFPAHIHFSRLGINNIADPLFGVLMLAFLARGVKDQRQADYAAAGVMLGLTQFFYEGGRVVYPLVAVAWVLGLVMLRRTRMNQAALTRFILFILVGVIVALPIYYTLVVVDRPLFARFETAGVGGSYWQTMQEYNREQTLEDHILRPLLAFVRNPDFSEFYGGVEAFVLIFMVPVFLAGVVYGLWRLRYPPTLLLLLWVATVAVGGMFLAESGHTARFVVAFPAVAVLATLGLWYVCLRRMWLVILVGAVLAIAQANYYFNDHLPTYNDQRRQFPDYQDALFRVAVLPAGSEACFVTPTPLDRNSIDNIMDFIAPEVEICYLEPDSLVPGYFDSFQGRSEMIAFLVEPDDEASMQVIERYFADNILGPLLSPYDTVPLHTQYRMYVFQP